MALFMRFPGGRAKALTLSYDDNVKQDFRMMEILDRHGLKCTFNINTGCFAQVSQPTRGAHDRGGGDFAVQRLAA